MKVQGFYINGQWQQPNSTNTFTTINPATEEIINQIPAGNAKDIDSAVAAARAAFDHGPWPKMTGAQRGEYLQKMADIINIRLDELSKLEVLDNGKPYPEAKWDIEDTAGTFEFYANLSKELDTNSEEVITLPEPGFSSKAVKSHWVSLALLFHGTSQC